MQIMAQNTLIREYKVIVKRVYHSIGLLTGKVEDVNIVKIASGFLLSLNTMDAIWLIEKKLSDKEYNESIVSYCIDKLISTSSVDAVLRLIFADTSQKFQLGMSMGKIFLNSLKVIYQLLFGR